MLGEWQSVIAYLPQEVFLIDDSLRANVALGVPEHLVDPDLLMRCLVQAKLLDVVKGLPDGVDSIVGERGIRLSGGQRQRIALARALYHQREVLILDEATSALDHDTERKIVEEIKLLKGDKTMIVIAHRITTLEHCDRIYKIEGGKITEVKTYQEIIESGGADRP